MQSSEDEYICLVVREFDDNYFKVELGYRVAIKCQKTNKQAHVSE